MEGDTSFSRLNMKLERGYLQPGEYAYAQNKRTRNGSAEDRPGTIMPHFANAVSYTGGIIGTGVFKNPNGEEVLLLATPTKIYQIREGTEPGEIALPSGTALAAPTEFVQAFNKLLLFRGADLPVLVWDGVSLEGFAPLPETTGLGPGIETIPNANTAEYFKNRLMIPYKEGFAMSDIGTLTWDTVLGYFRMNAGTSDDVVRLFTMGAALIVFKERSIVSLTNFTGPDPNEAVLETLNSTLGCAARKAVTMVGGDVFFLSAPGGVYRVTQVLENRLQAAPEPVSDAVQPLIERINWRAAREKALMKAHGEYCYLAVPLDGATANNAVLVYNTVTQGWEGFDTWDGDFAIDDLHVTLYAGALRLYAIDRAAAAVYVLYEGKSDQLKSGEFWVRSRFETRGYAELPTDNRGKHIAATKNHRRVSLALATWSPRYSVSVITEGANEVTPLTPQPVTRDRRKFLKFGVPAFDPTNADGRFNDPFREDYSASGDAPGVDPGTEGIDIERKQETTERWGLRARGRWASIRVENTQGQCDVRAAVIENEPVQNNFRRAA